MIRTKFLLAAFAGTFVYVVLSLTAGTDGIWGYRQLAEQKAEISRQTASIQKINDELYLEYTALLKDNDVIAAYARKLDYVQNDEKLVKINGLRPYQTTLYDTGTVLKRHSVNSFSEEMCKGLGLVFFLLTFTMLMLAGNGRKQLKKIVKPAVQGIPVYDLPQI